MASDGIQVGQEDAPAFPEEDALQTGADLEEVARYAKHRGNLLKGTFTEMNDYDHPVDGVFWSDVTNKSLMRYDGGFVQHGIEHLATDVSTSPTQGSITTTLTAVANISVTVSLSRTSNLRVRLQLQTYSSVASDVIQIQLKDGATQVAEWTLAANSSPTVNATSQSQLVEIPLPGVTAGSHTYTVEVRRVAGSGSITVSPTAMGPNWLTVERVG